MYIKINGNIAKVVKRYNDYAWMIQFAETKEIVSVFYFLEEDWSYV